MAIDNNSNQGQHVIHAGIPLQTTQAPQNVINLMEIWWLIKRQKKIAIGVLFLSMLLGFTYAMLKPKTYSFSTTVQVGTVGFEGKTSLIESPDTALNKVLLAYIPFILSDFYREKPEVRGAYSINVNVPKKSDLLVIDAKGSLEQEPIYRDLIDRVVKKLVDDHSRITSLKIKTAEVSLAHAQNVLEGSKDAAKLISANLQRLDKTSELLHNQLNEKKSLLAEMTKNRKSVNSSGTTGAMSVLLIDSEIQRYQMLIDNLEKSLFIDLNQQRNELEKALSDNLRDQSDQQNNVDQLKNELANISNTKAVVPVMTSIAPVGMSKGLVMTISGILGILLSLLVATLYDVYQRQNQPA